MEPEKNDEKPTRLQKFWENFIGADPSKDFVEQKTKYENVSNAAAIYKIKRSF